MKRVFDIVIGLGGLILTAPLLLIGALGVLISSPGPMFYAASRIGRDGRPFVMYKLRSMHANTGGSVITSSGDSRIFAWGRLIRKLKIDELPQFLNVLRGEMSMVGPRPEDPKIVDQYYTPWMHETLQVAPGVTSAGAIFYYGMCEDMIDDSDPHGSYVDRVLGPKLAIERAYLDRASVSSDIVIMVLTFAAIIGRGLGWVVATPECDRRAAESWVPASAFPDATP